MDVIAGVFAQIMPVRLARHDPGCRARVWHARSRTQDHDRIADAIVQPRFHAESAGRHGELVKLYIAAGQNVCLDQVDESELAEITNERRAQARYREVGRACADPAGSRGDTFADDGEVVRSRRQIAVAGRREQDEILVADLLHFASGRIRDGPTHCREHVWQCALERDQQCFAAGGGQTDFPAWSVRGNLDPEIRGFARCEPGDAGAATIKIEFAHWNTHPIPNSATDQRVAHRNGAGTAEDSGVIAAWFKWAAHAHGQDSAIFIRACRRERALCPVTSGGPSRRHRPCRGRAWHQT